MSRRHGSVCVLQQFSGAAERGGAAAWSHTHGGYRPRIYLHQSRVPHLFAPQRPSVCVTDPLLLCDSLDCLLSTDGIPVQRRMIRRMESWQSDDVGMLSMIAATTTHDHCSPADPVLMLSCHPILLSGQLAC